MDCCCPLLFIPEFMLGSSVSLTRILESEHYGHVNSVCQNIKYSLNSRIATGNAKRGNVRSQNLPYQLESVQGIECPS